MAEENQSAEHSVPAEDREELRQFAASKDQEDAIADALALIVSYNSGDGYRMQNWMMDQVVRKLTGENYERFLDFHDLGSIEGLDLSDPEAVAKARKIGSGDYYDGDFTDEEIARVEAGYYSWKDGIDE